jgi:hypothetical protein
MAYEKPRPQPLSADEREREAFHETVEDQIGDRDDNAVVVTIDQLRKTVGADLTYLWFPIDARPTTDVSASRDGLDPLGALTEHGETLFLECNGSLTNEVKNFVEGTAIDLVCFSTGSPDLNPIEECWRRLGKTLGNQYFGSLDELRTAIRPALESIDPPGIYQYLCR